MRVTLIPRIGVELIDVRVVEASTTARIFSARRMHLVVQALPLLRGDVIGTRLLIEQPHVELHRDETGRWSLAPSAGRPLAGPVQRDTPLSFVGRDRNVLVTDGRVTLTDSSGPTPRKVQFVTGLQAIIAEGIPGRTATVEVQGEIAGESDTATFGLEGTLIQTSLENAEQLAAASPYPLQFDGTVRVATLDVRQVAVWLGWGEVMEGWYGSVGFSGRVRLVPRVTGYDLIVPEWTANLRGISLRGDARLIGLNTETPVFSATMSSPPLPLRQWLNHIPERWIPAQILSLVGEHDAQGLLAVRTAALSGALNSPSPVDVAAELEISEGRFHLATQQSRVQGVTATMFYDHEGVRVVNVQGEYGPLHVSDGAIAITNIGTDPSVDAHFTGVVQVDGLIALARTFNAPYVESFFTGFEQTHGEIGPMAAEGPTLMDADVTISDTGFRTPTLPVPIYKLNGHLGYSLGIVRIDTLTGQVGPAQLKAWGSVTIAAGVAYQALHVQLTAEGADLAVLLPTTAGGNRPAIAGPLRCDATVSGPMPTPRIVGTLKLEEATLGIPAIVTKPKGAPRRLSSRV